MGGGGGGGVNSEKIALVYFLRFLAFCLGRKIKFRKVEKGKHIFSVNSQNLLHTIFCKSTRTC